MARVFNTLITINVIIQKNFKDVNLREIARQKAASRRVGTSEAPKYRDRASERRTLFNQPDAPIPEKDPSVSKKRQVEVPPPPVPPPVDLANDEANVGNKLLKMMGWKTGSGLGSEGDGRVNPMFVEIYHISGEFNQSLYQRNGRVLARDGLGG